MAMPSTAGLLWGRVSCVVARGFAGGPIIRQLTRLSGGRFIRGALGAARGAWPHCKPVVVIALPCNTEHFCS